MYFDHDVNKILCCRLALPWAWTVHKRTPQKIFSFFVEMQMPNDYKFNVLVIEILHFSVTAFCRMETVSLGRDSFISHMA
jgi:hypothetical protein